MRISDWSADVCSSDLAGHERGFDLQQVAADLGPGQPRDQADLVVLLGAAEVEALHAQVLLEVLRGHAQRARLLLACSRGHRPAQPDLLAHLAADLGALALPVAPHIGRPSCRVSVLQYLLCSGWAA